jgi:hypothetical protein
MKSKTGDLGGGDNVIVGKRGLCRSVIDISTTWCNSCGFGVSVDLQAQLTVEAATGTFLNSGQAHLFTGSVYEVTGIIGTLNGNVSVPHAHIAPRSSGQVSREARKIPAAGALFLTSRFIELSRPFIAKAELPRGPGQCLRVLPGPHRGAIEPWTVDASGKSFHEKAG